MSYGIELLNSFDERVLDFEQCVFEHGRGVCQRVRSVTGSNISNLSFYNGPDNLTYGPMGHFNEGNTGYLLWNYDVSSAAPIGGSALPSRQLQYTGGTPSSVPYRTGNYYGEIDLPQIISDVDTELFIEMPPEGVTSLNVMVQKYDQYTKGVIGYVQPHHTCTQLLGYVYGRPYLPNAPVSEDYGMQLLNNSGQVVFDSRHPIMTFSDYVKVPRSTIQDILYNDATYTYPLRQTIQNPYIFSSDFSNSLINLNSGTQFLVRAQLINSNSTLKLSREGYDRTFKFLIGYEGLEYTSETNIHFMDLPV